MLCSRCLDFDILDENGSISSPLEQKKNDQERISPVIPDAVQQQATRPIAIDVKTHQVFNGFLIPWHYIVFNTK